MRSPGQAARRHVRLVVIALALAAPWSAAAQDTDAEAVVGEAPIAAGNTAGARDRAMNEAFRQLVERALTALVAEMAAAPPAPAAMASLRAGWLQRPRRLVQSYRILEEGEVSGNFRVRLTAVLDLAFLRRELDRTRAGAGRGPAPGALPLVASGPAEAGAAVTAALAAAGVALAPSPDTASDLVKVRALAGRSTRGAALLVSGTAAAEGRVRGTSQQAVECHLGVRVVPAGEAAPAPERGASARAFAAKDADARADCFGKASAALLPALLPDLGVAGGGDSRAVLLGLDLAEPAALSPVLRSLRRVGGVARAEVRRVQVGRAEVQVSTRLAPEALVGALTRELAATATVARGDRQGDRLELKVRLLPPPDAAPPAAAPAPPAGGVPAAPAAGGAP